MTETNKRCAQLVPYFLKELSIEDTRAFTDHVSSCPACHSELQAMLQAWQSLPGEMEMIDVPEADREQMWQRIAAQIEDPPVPGELEKARRKENGKSAGAALTARKKWVFPAAAAVLCIAIGAAAGWGLNSGGIPSSWHKDATSEEPSFVVEQYVLKAFDSTMTGASGKGWVRQQGQSRQLVLEVNGLQASSGDQAYQLWVIKDGNRFNGGTFRVDEKGSSVMIYDLNVTQGTFEAIGITLEPDGKGMQPRGKKVLGT